MQNRDERQFDVRRNEPRGGNTAQVTSKRNTSPVNDALYSPLSIKNYKNKFDQLIKAEKESHEGILRERYLSHG